MTQASFAPRMPLREILWPALRGDPVAALAGLYWIATRRRVRGWSRLLCAASLYPHNYARWVTHCERRAFVDFRLAKPGSASLRIVTLIVANDADEHCVARTEASARAAFGADARVIVSAGDRWQLPLAVSPDEDAWVLPLLAGDQVSPELGDVLARDIASSANAGLTFWDEDRLTDGRRCEPWIKPDWDELLFRQVGGLAGACAMSLRQMRENIGEAHSVPLDRTMLERFAIDFGRRVVSSHVPLVLTHRSSACRSRLAPSAARGTPPASPLASVSIIVPTRDRADLLRPCVQGIRNTPYAGHVELVVIDNGSSDPQALRLLDELQKERRTRLIRDPGPFNFSRLNNRAAAAADGDFLCFLNNDVEPLSEDWLSLMVAHAAEQGVGAVGALLLYPSGRVQHAGVAIGLGGAAGHVQKGVDPADRRFWTWHGVSREVSAVTAAAMVVRKSTFLEVGGFDEKAFPVAFNDVDLCLRLKRAGLRNLYIADARLLHRESESRGDDRAPHRAAQFAAELKQLQQRWDTKDFIDPHFSPLFSRASERCVLAL